MLVATPAASANPAITPPTAGPTNWLAVSSTAYSRLLARSSWRGSRTRFGRIDWPAVSNRVSPTPSAKATAHSIHSCWLPAATTSVSAPRTTTRPTFTSTIVRRRSSRSARAPAGRATSSHGSRATSATVANAAGSRVMLRATSGSTVCSAPSARFDAADEAIRRPRLRSVVTD